MEGPGRRPWRDKLEEREVLASAGGTRGARPGGRAGGKPERVMILDELGGTVA